MLAGISTACLYPENTEKALSLLCNADIQATEIFLNSTSELEPSFLKELRKIADDSGTRILSVHPFTSGMEPILFFSQYQRRFNDGRDLYKRFYEAALLLGAELVVFHGNLVQLRVEPDFYYQRFGALLEDAAQMGVRLCHENVSRCAGRDPAFFRELRKELPEAEYVLDIKQCIRSGGEVLDFVEAMGDKIAHVHISDHGPGEDCLSIGKGELNIRGLLLQLKETGFDGGIIVELYRENFTDLVELLGGYQLLSQHISTVS